MPLDVSQIRRRVLGRLGEVKRAAVARHEQVVEAERAYQVFLAEAARPVFTAFAQSLSAEGYPYRVLTPGETVRLVSERANRTYVDVRLDTSGQAPVVMAEVCRERGSRVISDDRPVADGVAIHDLTDEHVVAFLLTAMADLIDR
ncbi:MAG: hypothetical protein AABY89_03345 [Acidobacteriota bacterium]